MAKLVVTDGPYRGRVFDLTKETVFLGRSSKNDVRIIDFSVSRKHLKVFRIGNSFFVEDLNSSNGTYVNDEFIEPGQAYQVDEGDEIALGRNTRLRLGGLHGKQDFWVEDIVPSLEKAPMELAEVPLPERRSRSSNAVQFVSCVAEALAEISDLNEFIESMLRVILDALPRVDRAALFLWDDEKEKARNFVSSRNPESDDRAVPLNKDIVERALKEKRPVIIADTAHDSSYSPSEAYDTLEIKSVIGLPFTAGSEILGVLYLDGIRMSYVSREEDIPMLQAMCSLASFAVVHSQMSSKLSLIKKLSIGT